MTTAQDNLENEQPENPYKRYCVEFPFTCTFTIPKDGHNTKVTIETRSEHLHHAKSEDDIRLQLEKDHEIDAPLNAKRILKFISDELYGIEPRDIIVTYHPDYTIELATPEKVEEIVEDFLDEF